MSGFPINAQLTAIAIAYTNTADSLIADSVLPRIPTAQQFKYTKYDAAQGFSVPDTKVGRKSEPNMVDFGGEEVQSACLDYGLDDLVPNADIAAFDAMPKPAQGGPLGPQEISTMFLTNLVLLDREVRVANAIFNANNYVNGQKVVLSGTSQWSDYANSDPLEMLLNALDAPLVRPNKLVIGQAGWTKLRRHPKVVQAVFNSAQNSGVVSRAQLAELLEIEDIHIGSARVNVARKGQAPNYVRTWGNHASLIYTNKEAALTGQPTYGFTAQFGGRIAGALPEPKAGLRGGVRVRAGESVKEVVCAPDTGFLIQNII